MTEVTHKPLAVPRRRWIQQLGGRSALTLALVGATVALVAALATLRASAADVSVLPLQLALVGVFCCLALLYFPAAAALAIFELVLGGAGGRWTVLPGGISGRLVFVGVVFAAAVVSLARRRRLGNALQDTYLLHGLALAVLFGGVWFTLGVLNGHPRSFVVKDGNGLLFFGFIVVIVALLDEVGAEWIWRVLLAACIVNGVVIAALDVAAATHIVALRPTLDDILGGRLQMGGVNGVLPDGSPRLSPGNAFYLEVGLALVTASLIQRPRQLALWAAYGLLWIAVVMTYTRGYWAGSVVAVGLTLALGASRWRASAAVVVGTASLAGLAAVVLAAGGFSLRASVVDRLLGTHRHGSAEAAIQPASTEWMRRFLDPSTAPTAQTRRPNYVVNGGFERGVDGWYSVPGSDLAASTTHAHSGRAAAKLSSETGPYANLGYYALKLPAVPVKVSAWIYVPASSRRTPIVLREELFDAATGSEGAQINVHEVNRWQKVEFTFRPSPRDRLGAVVVRARLRPRVRPVIWIDDVRVSARLIENGSFDRNVSGWMPGPVATIRPTKRHSHTGRGAARLTYRDRSRNLNLAYTTLASAPAPTAASAWISVARSWPKSAGVTFRAEGFAGAEGKMVAFADMKRGSKWQPLKLAFTPSGHDLAGYLVIRALRPSKNGATIDIDDVVARPEVSGLHASAADIAAAGGGVTRLSNKIRSEQAHVLWRYISRRPAAGYGFGAVAPELRPTHAPCARSWQCAPAYSYELSYFDLAFKTGLLGLILFFSLHARVLIDAIRIRFGRRSPPTGIERHDVAVATAIVCSVTVTGATNPYVVAAFGLFPVLAAVAWVDDEPNRSSAHLSRGPRPFARLIRRNRT